MPASRPVLKPSAPSSPPAAALPYKREHLIWEPGFGRRFLLSLALCGVLLLAAKHSQEAWLHGMAFQAWLTGWMMWFSHQLQWWSVLGLLSSSCCVLQLLLNAFSLGCAGFNTWLGPLRPLMLAVTVSLQASMWRVALTGRREGLLLNAAGATALTGVLSLLPELLHLYIHRNDEAKRCAPADGAEMCFRVEGMGCTACTAKVQKTVEALPGVAGCRVQLEGGEARVRLDEMAVADARMAAALQRSVATALQQVGFPATPSETPATAEALKR
jgi:copper chaperone CopZ